LQAFIGIGQLKKAENVILKRNLYYNFFKDNLALDWKPKQNEDKFVSNFCYPIISVNKDKIVKNLLENNIECRPLICGSMGKQPFYKNLYGETILPNASLVDKYGIYIPNNPDLTHAEMIFIAKIINSAI